MAQQIRNPKDNSFKGYVPGVLYIITFFAVIQTFQDTYVRYLVAQFATVPYKDNLASMPVAVPVFHFIYCVIFYYANRRAFEVLKKENFGIWMKHLGIDMVLYALCLLLTVGYDNYVQKANASLRGVEGPTVIFFVFYFKHFALRQWYKYKVSRRLRVVK